MPARHWFHRPLKGGIDEQEISLNVRWWQEALIPRARALLAWIGFKPKVIDKTVEGVSFKFFVSTSIAAVWYGDFGSDSSIEMRFVRDRMLSSE